MEEEELLLEKRCYCFDSILINVGITTKVDQERQVKCEGVPRKVVRFVLRREEAFSGQGKMEERS